MAHYYTNFSCELDVLTPENAALVMQLYSALSSDDDGFTDPNFQISIDLATGEIIEWVTTNHWLTERLERGGDHAGDR